MRAKRTTLCNLLTTYAVNGWQISAEIINVFDREAADIAYWYGSRTATETEVIDDVHYHLLCLERSVWACATRFSIPN